VVEPVVSQVEMDSVCPRTALAQAETDFARAEMADAAAEIAGEGAEAETADVAAEMDFASAEMDLAGMDLLRAEALAPSVPSSDRSKSSDRSDSAIQMGC